MITREALIEALMESGIQMADLHSRKLFGRGYQKTPKYRQIMRTKGSALPPKTAQKLRRKARAKGKRGKYMMATQATPVRGATPLHRRRMMVVRSVATDHGGKVWKGVSKDRGLKPGYTRYVQKRKPLAKLWKKKYYTVRRYK